SSLVGAAARAASGGDVALELVEPGRGRGVARRPPVATRRERTARADLRAVRQRRALELVRVEAGEEHAQPAHDRRQVVLVALLWRQQVGVLADGPIAPRVVREVRDLRRAVAE